MLKLLRRKNGLTLVELVVTLAILGIVISLVFSMNIFGTKMANKGSNQSDVQNGVRQAANYITSDIRYANSVEILSAMPATPDVQKIYFYVDGNTVKQLSLGTTKDLLHETSADFIPVLQFERNASNGKILNFTIQVTYKGQNFQIKSEVLALNIEPVNNIQGLSGVVIAYSSPLTDTETVTRDKQLLKIEENNAFLNLEADGSWTLMPPPDPNLLSLPSLGFYGSTISWSSSNVSVAKNDGTILRPEINAGNKTVVMTATLTKGAVTLTKVFTVNVSDLDPLILGNTNPADVAIGVLYNHTFTATGGDAAYSFSTGDDLHGLTLDTNGHLIGTLSTGTTDFSFTLKVQDGYSVPNVQTELINITVAP